MHIVSKEEMYAIDQFAIKRIGMSGVLLMENAGQALYQAMKARIKKNDRIGVVIGKGNNGGDGFVVSRYLIQNGYHVEAWLVSDLDHIQGEAKKHMEIFLNSGGEIKRGIESFKVALLSYTVIVDALLGIGVQGEVKAPYLEFIQAINQSQAKIIAVDIPSGVPANGGAFQHDVIGACETLTIHRPKIAQFTFPANDFYGETEVLDIGIPAWKQQDIHIERELWLEKDVLKTLPQRRKNAHKGNNGKGLLIAGSESMPGAACLSGLAAIRSGSGLLSIGAPEMIRTVIGSRVPEATFELALDPQEILSTSEKYDGIAIGPGLGRTSGARDQVTAILQVKKPLLMDADGLYHLEGQLERLKNRPSPTILTPHSGEMARLLGCSAQEVEEDRFGLSKDFAVSYGVYLVLKGRYTIVTTPTGKQYVNPTGNPALAKGGSGDVLTGMILSFFLQIREYHEAYLQPAISNAIFIHGLVADELIKNTHAMMDVRASDIIDGIPNVLHTLFKKYES